MAKTVHIKTETSKRKTNMKTGTTGHETEENELW
jgi:hypothetical protein